MAVLMNNDVNTDVTAQPSDPAGRKLSKPVYEMLPYLYIVIGALGFLGAYLLAGRIWSDISLVLGMAGVLGGLVLVLRRRDYRTNRTRYSGGTFKADVDSSLPNRHEH